MGLTFALRLTAWTGVANPTTGAEHEAEVRHWGTHQQEVGLGVAVYLSVGALECPRHPATGDVSTTIVSELERPERAPRENLSTA